MAQIKILEGRSLSLRAHFVGRYPLYGKKHGSGIAFTETHLKTCLASFFANANGSLPVTPLYGIRYCQNFCYTNYKICVICANLCLSVDFFTMPECSQQYSPVYMPVLRRVLSDPRGRSKLCLVLLRGLPTRLLNLL